MKSFSSLSLALVISIIFCGFFTMGQEIPELTAAEIPGFTVNQNECFNGESLWGYMNGGADIYLEYGFEILRVEEFTNEDESIKLELFKMNDPISAFGIYSIKTFKCEQGNVITDIDCLNRFQFQLLYGDYYIQLINESGSAKAKEAMMSIAETALKKIDEIGLMLPITYLTDSLGLPLFDIKMVKGDLGIHNKTPALEGFFEGIEDYQIYYAKTVKGGEKVKYYEIVFNAPENKHKFLENNTDKDLHFILENELNILFELR